MKNPIAPACNCAGLVEIHVVYGRGRFPMERKRGNDGVKPCRGCGGPVPPKQQTWCCRTCKNRFDPGFVLMHVRARDKGICQKCGDQTRHADPDTRNRVFRENGNTWRGIPDAHFDHIIPFSEGGLTVMENMRTLCEKCHKHVTAEWHKSRAAARALAEQLP